MFGFNEMRKSSQSARSTQCESFVKTWQKSGVFNLYMPNRRQHYDRDKKMWYGLAPISSVWSWELFNRILSCLHGHSDDLCNTKSCQAGAICIGLSNQVVLQRNERKTQELKLNIIQTQVEHTQLVQGPWHKTHDMTLWELFSKQTISLPEDIPDISYAVQNVD